MAKFTTDLKITTPNESTSAVLGGEYEEVFHLTQSVDNTDTLYTILSNSMAPGSLTLPDCKTLMIKNTGQVGLELNFLLREWTDSAPDAVNSASFLNSFLASGEFMVLPNLRMVAFANSNSAGNAAVLDNQVPDANMYLASSETSHDDTGADITGSASNDTVHITGNDTDVFRLGDLIRVNDEIMEVTEVNTTGGYLKVLRGLYGSTASSGHADGAAIRFPFFNMYADFDKYSTVQTDSSGRFKSMNFFGYSRSSEVYANGLVPGSVSGKFYEAGYQEFGLSGLTTATESGLAAGTAYAFDISVDGASDETIIFTTVSTTKWGGSQGVIRKIQDALDAEYHTTSSNMLNKKVKVAIVNGDIRFTSAQHLSTSAISITAPASGTTPFGVGALPAVGDIEKAVAARLPDDEVYDNKTNVAGSNINKMFYDDGHGNIKGMATGTINYETGAIDFHSAPANANFVVSVNYRSAFSGGNKFETTDANSIQVIQARSTNSKIKAHLELMAVR